MKLRNIAIALCSAALTGCGSMAEWRTVPGEYYNQGTYYYGGYPPAPGYGQTPPPPPPTSKPHKPSKPTPPPQQHQPQKPQKPQQQKPQQQKPQQQKPQQPTTNAQPNHPINTKPATPSTGNTSLRPGAANQTKPSTQPATQPAQPSRPATTGRH